MKRTSAALGDDDLSLINHAQSGQAHDPDLDQLLAKRLFPYGVPEKGKCAALDAFLRCQPPSPEDFVSCLHWCVTNRRLDILIEMQSRHSAFQDDLYLSSWSDEKATLLMDTLQLYRIAYRLTLELSDAKDSLQLKSWLASPQCTITALTLTLPAWDRLSNGSLLAGLGRAIAACPSIQHLSLRGPEQGKCELETAFIEEVIAMPHLLSVDLGTGLAWHDEAWPDLGTRILRRMQKRKDAGSMSVQLANAYANAIALNGARSGRYRAELGLSSTWRSPIAQELAAKEDAMKGSTQNAEIPSLEFVTYRPPDDQYWDWWLVQQPASATDAENFLALGAAGGARYLVVNFPEVPMRGQEKNLFGFLAGLSPFAPNEDEENFIETLQWCAPINSIDVMKAIQVRYPGYIGHIPACVSFSKELQAAHDVGVVVDLTIDEEDQDLNSVGVAIQTLKMPNVAIRAVMLKWDSGDDAPFEKLQPVLEAVAQATSVVKVTLMFSANDPADQLSLMSLALAAKSIEAIKFESASTEIDCDKLQLIIKEALRGPLQELDIKANDRVLRTCVEAIAAAGSACRLAKLKLRRLDNAEPCNIDLGMLLRKQKSISHLAVGAAIVHGYGVPLFVEAILGNTSIAKIEVPDDADERIASALPAIEARLQINRKRYGEVVPAML
ncbi:hypothetical protein [Variovorax guangxiensis]|uniref:hypothetical protein n=1 Tax=Variovorax guangxiensis TaxID=1775474 RepID=UPI00285ABF41|nr:hypothetical protein [Variovorax guangxiensis]MDR6861476.1 hypothetical protein [Variovorax guangxiensis]